MTRCLLPFSNLIPDTICMGPSNEGWRSLCTSSTRMQLRDHVITIMRPSFFKKRKVDGIDSVLCNVAFTFLVYLRHTCVFFLEEPSDQARCRYSLPFNSYFTSLLFIGWFAIYPVPRRHALHFPLFTRFFWVTRSHRPYITLPLLLWLAYVIQAL